MIISIMNAYRNEANLFSTKVEELCEFQSEVNLRGIGQVHGLKCSRITSDHPLLRLESSLSQYWHLCNRMFLLQYRGEKAEPFVSFMMGAVSRIWFLS